MQLTKLSILKAGHRSICMERCGIMLEKVNISEKLGQFQDHWSPKIVGDVGDCQVKRIYVQTLA